VHVLVCCDEEHGKDQKSASECICVACCRDRNFVGIMNKKWCDVGLCGVLSAWGDLLRYCCAVYDCVLDCRGCLIDREKEKLIF
jgi:hypothetical protein